MRSKRERERERERERPKGREGAENSSKGFGRKLDRTDEHAVEMRERGRREGDAAAAALLACLFAPPSLTTPTLEAIGTEAYRVDQSTGSDSISMINAAYFCFHYGLRVMREIRLL